MKRESTNIALKNFNVRSHDASTGDLEQSTSVWATDIDDAQKLSKVQSNEQSKIVTTPEPKNNIKIRGEFSPDMKIVKNVSDDHKFTFSDDDINNMLNEFDDGMDEDLVISPAQPISTYDSVDDEPFVLVSDVDKTVDAQPDRTLSTPEPGPAMGVASVINSLIRDEWEAIQGYNDAIASLANEKGYDDIIKILRDIANEENIHVGQLQRSLECVSPNAMSIEDGRMEATEQIELDPPANFAPVRSAGTFQPLKVENAVPVGSPAQTNNQPEFSLEDECSVMDADDTF